VAASFVPVAVNLYKIREARGTAGEVFRAAQRQKGQYQGIWILDPAGRVLAAHHEVHDPRAWSREVLAAIDQALATFGSVSARSVPAGDPLPRRGCGLAPDGGVTLAIYSRYVAGGGREQAPAAADPASLWIWDGAFRTDGPAVIDSLDLTRSEWLALASPRVAVGAQRQVPASLARKLVRVLSPSSDQSTMPRPDEAEAARLTATVTTVGRGTASIRLAGDWQASHLYDGKRSHAWARAEGEIVYDLRQRAPRSLLLVFHGAHRSPPPYDRGVRPIAGVAEWRATTGASSLASR
jgi:hypothetical protein